MNKTEKPPITCNECGRALTEDEAERFFDEIEDGDKPYCHGCIDKMALAEHTGDDDDN